MRSKTETLPRTSHRWGPVGLRQRLFPVLLHLVSDSFLGPSENEFAYFGYCSIHNIYLALRKAVILLQKACLVALTCNPVECIQDTSLWIKWWKHVSTLSEASFCYLENTFKSGVSLLQLFLLPEALLFGAKKLNDYLFFAQVVCSCHLRILGQNWFCCWQHISYILVLSDYQWDLLLKSETLVLCLKIRVEAWVGKILLLVSDQKGTLGESFHTWASLTPPEPLRYDLLMLNIEAFAFSCPPSVE